VSASAIAELMSAARSAVYDCGETVIGANRPHTPGLVVSGHVRLIVKAHDGREANLKTMGAGAMFGLIYMVESDPRPARVERSVVAIERSVVALMHGPTLRRAAARDSELGMYLFRNLADSANVLADAAGQFAFMTVRQRLAGHLLGLAVEVRGGLVVEATQQQLASSVGSVREVVARTLRDLRSEGLIRVARGRVTLLDRDGLAASAAI